MVILWTRIRPATSPPPRTFMPILAALATATGQPVTAVAGPGRDGRVLRLHAAGRHGPQRHRLRIRPHPGMRDMLRAGLWVNILRWGVIIAVTAVTLPWLV
ncbi:MAG: hypothetical protein MZW92_16015 [Comamonadaceae bacterium]|nr:hypothetical protein [Comamonadaceae bacterium]